MAEPESPWLVTTEAASYLRISVRTVHELTRCGEIPHRRFGRRCLFVKHELLEWLNGAPLETVPLPGGGRSVRIGPDKPTA